MAGSGEEALRCIADSEPQVVLLDLRLPGMDGIEVLKRITSAEHGPEVIMLTGHGSIDTAIESIRIGAFDYVLKPCPLNEIELRIQRAVERRALRQRASLLERGLTPPDLGDSFIGESTESRRLLQLIERVAPSESTVLITGETGSGKERVAKLIHARSPRRFSPFVIVDCAALQEGLLQSELFGHERGAFTGADRAKPGLFEVAHRGTIFLDEIGEVSQATQVNLLRVLDTSTFRHVGGTAEISVDVRVVAATNRDLAKMVKQGAFREDLFYRLSTITIEIAPLRERGGDIEIMARHFMATLNERFRCARQLSPAALQLLRAHNWPGNVRELRHAIEAAMIVCDGPEILPEHLPGAVRRSAPVHATSAPVNGRVQTLEELELAQIRLALEAAGGHRGNAAKMLGVSERNLYRKLREHRLVQ
jgi:DNA-binding NtrC family response regulator